MPTPALPSHDAAPVADLERRFRAYAVDRFLAWSVFAAAGVGAWWWFLREGRTWAGVAVVVGTVVVVSLVFAVLLGVRGTSPGRALTGLRVVDHATGAPIGVGRALLRTTLLGVSALPLFGLGVATLAWTAVEDRTRERRGWHDHVTGSLVVDVRPRPAEVVEEDERPRHIVNLTAMRLMPVSAPERAPVAVPSRAPGPRPAGGPTGVPPGVGPKSPAPAARGADRPAGGAPAPVPPAAGRRVAPGPPSGPNGTGQQPTGPPGRRIAGQPAGPPPPERDRTVLGSRKTSEPATGGGWRLSFDSGESLLVEGLGLVGRRPEGRPGEPVRHLLPLSSKDMSISKTHAQFHLAADGALVVMDRGSTNGSILIRRGVSRELSSGKPATLLDGDRVLIGDREMRVSRA